MARGQSAPGGTRQSLLSLTRSDNNDAMFDEHADLKTFMGDEAFGSVPQNGFTPVNGSGGSTHTVSPNELFLDHSAPNSNALTNLTTPSMYDGSPDDLDSFEASPLFYDSNNVGHAQWPSLFEHENATYASADLTSSTESLDKDHITNLTSVPMDRSTSSASLMGADKDIDRTDKRHRMSLTSGVTKNRRTGRSLAPIEVDEADVKAVKRAKNTMAARKSRQKKRDVEDQLRHDLDEMTAQRDRWMHIAIAHGAPIPETKVSPRSAERDDD